MKPTVTVAQPNNRILLSIGALVAVIGGIMAWFYWDTVRPNAEVLTDLMEDKVSDLLGERYSVGEVSFPSGTNGYRHPVSVQITEKATSKHDMITLIVTGDCDKSCRVWMDPADALRLALKAN